MQQSTSREANRFSASQEIPRILWKPEGSLPHSQVPTTCPYREPARSSSYPSQPNSWRSILILSSHLCLGLPSGRFPSGFPTKNLYTPLLTPHSLPRYDFITRTTYLNTAQYTGCFTTLGHNCRWWFPSLCDEKSSYKHVSDFGRLRIYDRFLIPVHALVWTASYSWRGH